MVSLSGIGWDETVTPSGWLFSLRAVSVLSFAFIYVFYHVTNILLQWWFYHRQGSTPEAKGRWKIQPQANPTSTASALLPRLPILEALGVVQPLPNSFPGGWKYKLMNAALAALFAGFAAELAARGFSQLSFETPSSAYGWGIVALQFVVAVTHESVVEYYWHRWMHSAAMYARFHRIHHHPTSPVPFDDMLIAPLEAFGYYCILYSPPFLYSTHAIAFGAYMAFMGLAGIVDHSGIRIVIPGLYDSEHHDLHHSRYIVNYGFPLPFMDLLHGTFEGTLCGRRYTARRFRKSGSNKATGGEDATQSGELPQKQE